MTKLLRPLQLAEALNVSGRLIRKWQLNRKISFIKVGMTTLFDLDKVVSELEKFERKAISVALPVSRLDASGAVVTSAQRTRNP